MALKAVLLDIDGTLLDSNDAHANAWQAALRWHGHDVPFERLRPLIGKGGDKLLSEVVGIDAKSALGQQIGDARRSVFTDRYLLQLRPTRGARELLRRLIDDGLRLVVATSASAEELGALLKQAGVEDLVQDAASSSDAESSKPDPDIVEAALRKARLDADEVLMLGDTPYDIEAAAVAGVQCIALRCGGWWTDASFAGALAIYDDPMDWLHGMETSRLQLAEALRSVGDRRNR